MITAMCKKVIKSEFEVKQKKSSMKKKSTNLIKVLTSTK